MHAVSVCICTYRRPQQLRALLEDLRAQTRLPDEVVVVDNDAPGSARATVEAFEQTGAPFPLRYDVQPQKNISLTRNRTVALATRPWLAFLDDDERVVPAWLQRLLEAQQRYGADGVLAPVVCQVPATAPRWILRGHFYALPRYPTGTVMPLNGLGIGNALLRADQVRAQPGPFDERFGLTGGEDWHLLARMVNAGSRLVWCDEALATEPVEPPRLKLRWLLRRALRGGQDYATLWRAGIFGRAGLAASLVFVSKAAAQLLVAALLVPLALPLGRHRAVNWLRKVWANFGKLSVFWGWHYREYAAPPTAKP